MLNEDELSAYFNKLPRDLIIVVDGSEYEVNKQIVESFSPVVKELISKKANSGGKLILDIKNHDNAFGQAMAFLHGKRIDITPFNDVYLNEIAKQLKIEPLAAAVAPSLAEEISPQNVIPRFLQNSDKKDPVLFHIILQNIEDLQHDENIFKLPEPDLVEICQNPDSKFSSETSRYVFKMHCAASDLENSSEFISEEDIKTMPFDAIKTLVTDETLEKLDGHIQTFSIATRIITEMTEVNSKITESQKNIDEIAKEIDVLREEFDMERKRILKDDEKYKQIDVKHKTIKKQITDITNKIQAHFDAIESFRLTEKTIDDVSAKLSFLKKKCDEMEDVVNGFSKGKLLYPETQQRITDTQKEWAEKMKSLQLLLSDLGSNDDEINKIIDAFKNITNELRSLTL